jgi:UDP-glucose 4-epimerase
VTSVLQGRRPTINGTGEVSRDFTFVDNVVRANLLAADRHVPSGITCNVACGDRHTLIQLLESICRAAGRSVDPIFGPPRPGDIMHSLADIGAARESMGYEVTVPFDEGIARTVAWFESAVLTMAAPA